MWSDGPAAIGMRRLSIIDLAGGHQPIFNESGRIGIVLNGEIYNYRELRAQLVAAGHSFRTHSDTEVIVHLYEDHGERCVEMLRGMFALAIWDADAKTLFLARDRFGIKPLYYAERDGAIAFASELKALVAAGETARTLDLVALDLFLQVGYIPAPRTPFVDVKKLPPAHSMMVRPNGAVSLREYWQLPKGTTEPSRDVGKQIREALDDSVRAHLESDVPIAALLSGGIDSSAVVSSMALLGTKAHAFTARYHGSGAANSDEVPLAQALAQKYGAQLTVVDIEPSVQDLLAPICFAMDEPISDESALPTWLISERVAQDYKVVLAGTGGDELFGGYRRHRALRLGSAYGLLPAAVRGGVSRAASLIREPQNGGLGLSRAKRFLRSGGGSVASRYADFVSRLSVEDFARLRGRERNAALHTRVFEDVLQQRGSDSAIRSALCIDYHTYLPDDLLALSDRIASAHSLEVRVPFVDHRLIDALFPLPDRLRIRRGQQKWMLREAVADRLTPAHMSAPKRGFVGPTAAWLRNELRDLLIDELSPARLSRLGLFDAPAVADWVTQHLTLRSNREGILWGLLCFSIWHRQMVESTPRST